MGCFEVNRNIITFKQKRMIEKMKMQRNILKQGYKIAKNKRSERIYD